MWLFVLGCTSEKENPTPIVQETAEERPVVEEVLIVAGIFQMGCTEGDENCSLNEEPAHSVEITRNYYMLTTEVTQELYEWVTGDNPSEFTISGQYPVEEVSWYDAVHFSNELSILEGFEPCYEVLEDIDGEMTVEWPLQLDCLGYGIRSLNNWVPPFS